MSEAKHVLVLSPELTAKAKSVQALQLPADSTSEVDAHADAFELVRAAEIVEISGELAAIQPDAQRMAMAAEIVLLRATVAKVEALAQRCLRLPHTGELANVEADEPPATSHHVWFGEQLQEALTGGP